MSRAGDILTLPSVYFQFNLSYFSFGKKSYDLAEIAYNKIKQLNLSTDEEFAYKIYALKYYFRNELRDFSKHYERATVLQEIAQEY